MKKLSCLASVLFVVLFFVACSSEGEWVDQKTMIVPDDTTTDAAADNDAIATDNILTDNTVTDDVVTDNIATDEIISDDDTAVTDNTVTDDVLTDDIATDDVVTDEIITDDTEPTDDTVTDDTVTDDTVPDDTVTDDVVTDDTVTDDTVTDDTVTDNTVNDDTVTDDTVTDDTVNDDTTTDDTVTDNTVTDDVLTDDIATDDVVTDEIITDDTVTDDTTTDADIVITDPDAGTEGHECRPIEPACDEGLYCSIEGNICYVQTPATANEGEENGPCKYGAVCDGDPSVTGTKLFCGILDNICHPLTEASLVNMVTWDSAVIGYQTSCEQYTDAVYTYWSKPYEPFQSVYTCASYPVTAPTQYSTSRAMCYVTEAYQPVTDHLQEIVDLQMANPGVSLSELDVCEIGQGYYF